MSQINSSDINYFIGKWEAIENSTSPKKLMLCFIDNENVEMTFDTLKFYAKYVIQVSQDSSVLTLTREKIPTQKMVITWESNDVFYLNSIENHSRYLNVKNAKSGNVAWGWSDPAPVKFERQY